MGLADGTEQPRHVVVKVDRARDPGAAVDQEHGSEGCGLRRVIDAARDVAGGTRDDDVTHDADFRLEPVGKDVGVDVIADGDDAFAVGWRETARERMHGAERSGLECAMTTMQMMEQRTFNERNGWSVAAA